MCVEVEYRSTDRLAKRNIGKIRAPYVTDINHVVTNEWRSAEDNFAKKVGV